MTRIKYGYARVSTIGQDLNTQIEQLKKAGATEIFSEKVTGTTADRQEFQKLLDVIGEGDELIITKLDRFARSTQDALNIVEQLHDKGVSINILNVGRVDDTATGKLMLTMLSAFAEFERNLIVERMQEGKEYKRKNDPNYREGRPNKYSRQQLDHAMQLLESHTYTEVEEMTGISRSTLTRERRKRREKEKANL